MHRLLLLLGLLTVACGAAELRVCATVPELGDLVRRVGGGQVAVTVFARPGDDPHHIDARPSFVRDLARADALVLVGMDLELGWVPALLQSCRNRGAQPGAPGYIDCAVAIVHPLGVPDQALDRSYGDVHPHGNPHYLLDPLNGLRVARLISERLSALAPEHRDAFADGYRSFAAELLTALVGAELAEELSVEQALAWDADGSWDTQLDRHGARLGGWLGLLAPHRGSVFVDHHDRWAYLARRYHLRVCAHLEPKPGIPPSSAHLGEVIALIRAERATALVIAPTVDPRPAELVAEATGIGIVRLAHQVGAVPESGDYLSFCAANAQRLAAAFAQQP